MGKELNFEQVAQIRDKDLRFSKVQDILDEFSQYDPPSLSDIFVNLDFGGQAFLIGLEAQEKIEGTPGGSPFMWRIKVLCDEWGKPVKPGDEIVRVIPINMYDHKGYPVGASRQNAAKMDGSYSKKFERRRVYKVDKDGCIKCSFSDAGYFLFNWGVHYKTGFGMSGKPELSQGPSDHPDGGKRHVHYWRYKEVVGPTSDNGKGKVEE